MRLSLVRWACWFAGVLAVFGGLISLADSQGSVPASSHELSSLAGDTKVLGRATMNPDKAYCEFKKIPCGSGCCLCTDAGAKKATLFVGPNYSNIVVEHCKNFNIYYSPDCTGPSEGREGICNGLSWHNYFDP